MDIISELIFAATSLFASIVVLSVTIAGFNLGRRWFGKISESEKFEQDYDSWYRDNNK